MIKIDFSVVVNRPPAAVFEYLTDPANLPQWQSGVTEARLVSDGPMGVGSRMTDVRSMLGRKMESTVEVTEYEPPKLFSLKSITGPVQFQVRHTLEPSDGGTKLTFAGQGEPGGFFKLAEPVVARTVERRFKADLETLKDMLESSA